VAKYRILGDCWLDFPDGGPRLVQPFTEVTGPDGKPLQVETVVEYDGWPNAVMEPLDDEGRELAEVVHRLRSTKQLPATPAAWREQREREKQEREKQERVKLNA
jgi:hypothetical protein